jgi:putative ABC transport system substrate-binding protein
MIARKLACVLQLVMFLAAAPSAAGDKPSPVRQIGIVSIGTSDTVLPQIRGLYDGLEEVGYVEGNNLKIQRLRAEKDDAAFRAMLAAAIRRGIEVIVTPSSTEAVLAKQVTSTIPIVFAPAVDPVRNRLVHSHVSPHSNLTGLSYTRDVEDRAKQLAVFKQIVPNLRRVMLFYDGRPIARTPASVLAAIRRAAQRLYLQLTEHAVQSTVEAVQILERAPAAGVDGVFLVCSAVFRGMRPLSEMGARKRLPVFSCTASQVADEGTLMTYSPDMYYLGYRGAWYVDRLLKGARPAQLRVETPIRFELVINLTSARKLGVVIRPEALMLADKVFE